MPSRAWFSQELVGYGIGGASNVVLLFSLSCLHSKCAVSHISIYTTYTNVGSFFKEEINAPYSKRREDKASDGETIR